MPAGGVGSWGKRLIQIWSDLAYPPTVPGPSPVIGINIYVLGEICGALFCSPESIWKEREVLFPFCCFFGVISNSPIRPVSHWQWVCYTGVLFCSPDITCTAHPGVCSGLHNSCDHSRFGDSKLIWSADFESSHTLFYQHALPWPVTTLVKLSVRRLKAVWELWKEPLQNPSSWSDTSNIAWSSNSSVALLE